MKKNLELFKGFMTQNKMQVVFDICFILVVFYIAIKFVNIEFAMVVSIFLSIYIVSTWIAFQKAFNNELENYIKKMVNHSLNNLIISESKDIIFKFYCEDTLEIASRTNDTRKLIRISDEFKALTKY